MYSRRIQGWISVSPATQCQHWLPERANEVGCYCRYPVYSYFHSPYQNNSMKHQSHTEVDEFCGQLEELSKAKQHPDNMNQHVKSNEMRTTEDFMRNNDQTNLYRRCTILQESVSKTMQSS